MRIVGLQYFKKVHYYITRSDDVTKDDDVTRGDDDMRIVGSKYLDRNDYSNITINYNEVVVKGNKSKYQVIPSEESFIDSLRELNDEEKRRRIIDYYLENHTVSSVSKIVFCNTAYQIGSVDGTTLRIARKMGNDVIDKIYGKYREDRGKFVDSRNFYESQVEFLSSFDSTGYIEDSKSCRFYISAFDGKVDENEKVFLIDVFSNMLPDGEAAITREDALDGLNVFNVSFLRKVDTASDYVDYGAPRVRVSKDLLPVIETLVMEHNEEFSKESENRPKQLRLEEFK